MSQKEYPVLSLLKDIWEDINDPQFIWQVTALIVCLGVAYLITSWWQKRHLEGTGRLTDASSRLVFPLSAMLLVGISRLALKPFFHVNLLKLALPLLGSMALVRSVIFVLRQAFPQGYLADCLGAHHYCGDLGLAGALYYRPGTDGD